MLNLGDDPKQQAILGAAWTVFATYGFKKTSMDDIARAAGVSRPAIYLHYRNKEDVFRTLIGLWYAQAVSELRAALSSPGSAQAQLSAGFDVQCGPMMEALLASPHGLELMDTGAVAPADTVTEGEERIAEAYGQWLDEGREAGQVAFDGPALEIARTITGAIKGVKTTAQDYASYRQSVLHLAALFGKGLPPT